MNILLIPRIKIINANALSSPYTIGFPAMTSWLGGVHALQRKINLIEDFEDIEFKSIGVVSHKVDLQTFNGQGDFDYSIIGTGNPLNKKGERSSFIEEPRCHLTVSLIVEFEDKAITSFSDLLENLTKLLNAGHKFAGGDIIKLDPIEHYDVHDEESRRFLLSKLMPGFCLIERRDLVIEEMEKGQDCLEALLEFLKINNNSVKDEEGNVSWSSFRKEKGWIVPIATGFHGITELGNVDNQRDPEVQHRFAESIVTLGEFIMPYRIKNISEMLWEYHADLGNNLYVCKQKMKR